MRYSILLLALASSACASASASRATTDAQREIIFDDKVGTVRTAANPAGTVIAVPASPDVTWNAIMSAYSLIGIEVKYLNRPAGELGNRDVMLSRRIKTGEISRYLDCGNDTFAGPQANSYPVRASLITRMWAEGSATSMETRLSGSMTKPGAGATVHCSSTGALETLIGVAVNKFSTQPSS